MKTVVICTDSLDMGGIEKGLVALSNALVEDNKIRVKICVKNHEKNYLEGLLPKDIELKYLKKKQKAKGIFRFFERIIELKEFKKFIADGDVIVDYYDGSWFKIFSKIKNKRKVVFLNTILKELYVYKLGKIEDVLNNTYDKYVVSSDGAIKELIDYGVDPAKVEKIYHILEPATIKIQSEDESNLTDEEKELLKDKYFVSVGRIVNDSKDYLTLIRAFENIEKKLYIVGDGPFKKELEEEVKRLGIEDRVKFIGQKKNPYIWIKKSQGLILSSRHEGLSVVILEALTLGKRVIASDCPFGCREILGNNKYGQLFKVGDVEELSKIVGNMPEDVEPEYYEEKLREFSSKVILEKFYKLID